VFTRNKHFHLEQELHLHNIDFTRGIVTIHDQEYPLKDTHFPTIDPRDPYRLHADEEDVIRQLQNAFLNNDLLQRHIKFLVQRGQMYLIYNHNLLIHGCIPLDKDGSCSTMTIDDQPYYGKSLLDELDRKVRSAYLNRFLL